MQSGPKILQTEAEELCEITFSIIIAAATAIQYLESKHRSDIETLIAKIES